MAATKKRTKCSYTIQQAQECFFAAKQADFEYFAQIAARRPLGQALRQAIMSFTCCAPGEEKLWERLADRMHPTLRQALLATVAPDLYSTVPNAAAREIIANRRTYPFRG